MKNMKSNIIIPSNIYPCIEEWTKDEEFMSQIFDYHKINNARKNKYSSYVPDFKRTQIAIIDNGTRCINSQDDPCRGYVKGKGGQCKCIKRDCKLISKCNPDLTEEYALFWETAGDDISLYGYPQKQKKYYLVDLVSEEEKKSYFSNPETSSKKYPIYNEKNEDSERKLIIIGYRRECFSDYCDEQLSPIYGYADKIIEEKTNSKYGSSKALFVNFHEESKKIETEEKKYNTFQDFSKELNKTNEKGNINIENEKIAIKDESIDYNFLWKELLCGCNEKQKYSIQELTEEYIDSLVRHAKKEKVVLIFENKGELGYASNMLHKLNIIHSYDIQQNVALILKTMNEVNEEIQGSVIFVSPTVFKKEYSAKSMNLVNVLTNTNNYALLNMKSKSFIECTMENGEKRWLMTNVYGATHIQIDSLDISIKSTKDEIELLLVDNMNEGYDVIDVDNGEIIGKSTSQLISCLNDLLFEGHIFGLPDKIENIRLQRINNKYHVLGLGHMVFMGY